MSNTERDFKGVWIPKEIWLNENLSMLEKVMYIEIDSLDNENHCFAGNDYFAKFCNCSQSAVTKAIKHLKELGMIEQISFDGRQRVLLCVGKNANQPSKIYEAESENLRTNNIASSKKDKYRKEKTIIINNNSTKSAKNTKQSQTKERESMYTKCVALINDITEDSETRNLLLEFWKMQVDINKELGTPFYTNMFKGKLNALQKIPEKDWKQAIQNALQNGWKNIYPLKEEQKKTKAGVDIKRDNAKTDKYTKAELEELDIWEKEMNARGIQTRF